IKVYRQLKEEFDLPALDIYLYKHIPLGAGLGGGSSDAAFMMKGLNEVFELGLSDYEMERRLAGLGADCAFFVQNVPAYATGIGDELTPIPLSLKGMYIVLVKPDVFVSTREAYAGVTPKEPEHDLLKALRRPVTEWRDRVVNDFEPSVFAAHPELAAVKQTLYDMGADYAAMSGSGSTLFGLFSRPVPEARKVFKEHFVWTEHLVV
ncbi:MAG: 4-(cytidine 5'-diphospho)-2-C-methyl-D-erythritol kinase, partial [Prevotellamassilia sp.]|nr:4-(cytidine 5'-diphospho)-2-C-methyl-D-erythritol kinase [Prevotellamassilia sp.]